MVSVDSSLLALPVGGQLSELFGGFEGDDSTQETATLVPHRNERLRCIGDDSFLLLVIGSLPRVSVRSMIATSRGLLALIRCESAWHAAYLRGLPDGAKIDFEHSWMGTALKATCGAMVSFPRWKCVRRKRKREEACIVAGSLGSGLSELSLVSAAVQGWSDLAKNAVPWADITPASFRRDFEATGTPLLGSAAVRNMEKAEGRYFGVNGWPAKWRADRLPHMLDESSSSRLPEDDLFGVIAPFGKMVRMTLESYLRYMRDKPVEDDPLYLFDSSHLAASLMKFISMPQHIDDMFDGIADENLLAGLERQYLTIGPPGSGARLHVDPFGASAASLLLTGRKAWALFPPRQRPPPGVRLVRCGGHLVPEIPPARWWWRQVFLPSHRVDDGAIGAATDRSGCVAFVQNAGDVVYTPSGWWHTTINLDVEPSVALTKHICTPANVPAVASELRQHGWEMVAERLSQELWERHT